MLSFLERIATSFWDVIRRTVALITPFAQSADYRGMGRGLLRVLHVVVLMAILGALGWVNWYFDLGKLLKAPSPFGIPLRNLWLPILFVLMYGIVWLAWWLWTLLSPQQYVSDFPDIDAAWAEGVQALNAAGIELIDAPLFLILGKPAGGDEALLKAAQIALTVKQTPARPDAPIHFHANRDGIYLTCPKASVLARLSELLYGEADGGGAAPGSLDGMSPSEEDMFKTLQPKGKLKDVQGVLARAREQGRGPDQLTEAEKEEIRLLVAEEEAEHQQAARKPPPSLLKNTAEVELATARLKHVCRLIVRDRRPYCPLNGVMVLLPFAATDRDEDASQAGALCQLELAAAREVLRVHCPVLAVLCDLEVAPGFREFVERFPADQRQRRLGQRFPLVPDLEADRVPAMVESGAGWVCLAMLPNWIYKLFRLEHPPREELDAVVRGNARLYRLMGEMRDRQKRLGRILTRGVIADAGGPPLFAGCYVAGTGRDPLREQAFVAGVFRRLTENQNWISWTDEALREESDNQRWTTYGYTGLGVAVVLVVALGFFTLSK